MDERLRHTIFMTAQVTVRGEKPFHVRIRDISDGGMKIATGTSLCVGDIVIVEIPRIGRVTARVAWHQARISGLAFSRKIDVSRVMREVSITPSLIRAREVKQALRVL